MKRVLIASGDPGLKGLLLPMLEGAGYEVVVAPSVVEAARSLEEDPAVLIVVDRDQPDGQSAFVFLRQLGASGSQVPVVLVCGGASPEDLLAGYRLGAAEVVRKPTRAGVIRALLTRLLPRAEP